MAWNYDPEDLSTDLNRVRLMVGDTDEDDPQLSDEEIEYLVDTYAGVETAAVHAARAIMAQYARLVTKAVGDLRISLSDRHAHYKELVDYLETIAATSDPYTFYIGGQSFDEIDSDARDIDLPPGRFAVGMHDFPRTGVSQRRPRNLSDLD